MGSLVILKKKLVLTQLALLPWLYGPCSLHGQGFTTVAASLTRIDGSEENSSSSARSSAEPAGDEAAEVTSSGHIRSVPTSVKKQFTARPFSTLAVSPRSSTLGLGVDIATPLSRGFNLRGGFNLMNFGYAFGIDGINYESRLHFRSGQLNLDWFPRHQGFHISPGLMYEENNLSAISGVPPGQSFELGSQVFLNSVDDPLNGTASIVIPRKIAPTITVGFSNMIPRSGQRLSFPVEFGVAYTGAPQIKLVLDGTACTNQGCLAFMQDQEAVASMQQEIQRLNEKLKKLPVYPIFSSGFALRF